MVSNLENLSESLTKQSGPTKDESRCFAELIKSNNRIQAELQERGFAYVTDEAGRNFIVRRKAAAATA